MSDGAHQETALERIAKAVVEVAESDGKTPITEPYHQQWWHNGTEWRIKIDPATGFVTVYAAGWPWAVIGIGEAVIGEGEGMEEGFLAAAAAYVRTKSE